MMNFAVGSEQLATHRVAELEGTESTIIHTHLVIFDLRKHIRQQEVDISLRL